MANGIEIDNENDVYEIYDAKRRDAMPESVYEMGREYIEYYKSSWYDKDNRGVFDTYSAVETLWEGESNQPYYASDPASNMNITHPQIETIVGSTVDRSLAIEVAADTKSEQPYISDITTMLEFIKRKNKIIRKLYTFVRRMAKFGNGVFRVLYDPDAINEFGLPDVTGLNPAFLFTDPNITNLEDFQDGKFCIETKLRSIEWAKKRFDPALADAILPGYNPIDGTDLFGEVPAEFRRYAREHYIHMYVFEKILVERQVEFELDDESKDLHTFYETKLKLVEMSADGVILSDTELMDNPPHFPDEDFPYFIGADYEREGSIWAKGDGELLMDPQEQINDFDDQMRSNARLFGNPQRWLDPSTGTDPSKWTNERGLTIPIIGGKDMLGYIQPYVMSPELINRRDRIVDTDVPKITRINDQMSGKRQKGVDSATEALALDAAGDTVTSEKVQMVEDVLADVFTYCFKLAVHYWDEEKMFAISGSKEFAQFVPSMLARIPALEPVDRDFINEFKKSNPGEKIPEYMNVYDSNDEICDKYAEVSIVVKIGTGTSKNKQFTYSAMKNAAENKMVKKSTYLKYMQREMDIPIPEEEIEEAKMIEDLQLKMLMAQLQTPGPPGGGSAGGASSGTKTSSGGTAPTANGMTSKGTPQRPGVTESGDVKSIGKDA